MLRCTGMDNLILGLACQLGVKVELCLRHLTGTALPEPRHNKVIPLRAFRTRRTRLNRG